MGKTADGIAGLPDEKVDERYKNLDPKMVEMIENEIMERKIDITWDDIAGLR
jgi:fidgetin-like protein 1